LGFNTFQHFIGTLELKTSSVISPRMSMHLIKFCYSDITCLCSDQSDQIADHMLCPINCRIQSNCILMILNHLNKFKVLFLFNRKAKLLTRGRRPRPLVLCTNASTALATQLSLRWWPSQIVNYSLCQCGCTMQKHSS